MTCSASRHYCLESLSAFSYAQRILTAKHFRQYVKQQTVDLWQNANAMAKVESHHVQLYLGIKGMTNVHMHAKLPLARSTRKLRAMHFWLSFVMPCVLVFGMKASACMAIVVVTTAPTSGSPSSVWVLNRLVFC